MRIRQFLSISFTNPLGNLLAAANIMMVTALVLEVAGINGKFVCDLNRPAILASEGLGGEFTASLFILQFVYLQWILIGDFAKVMAQKLKTR